LGGGEGEREGGRGTAGYNHYVPRRQKGGGGGEGKGKDAKKSEGAGLKSSLSSMLCWGGGRGDTGGEEGISFFSWGQEKGKKEARKGKKRETSRATLSNSLLSKRMEKGGEGQASEGGGEGVLPLISF